MNAQPPAVALRATDLTRRYGDLVAVDRLSLEVRRDEILGFLGPNGAGKTTTLRMLCGLLRPDSGRIEVEGMPIRHDRAAALHAVGHSPQSIAIWEMLTVFEQLEFMGRAYGLTRSAARTRANALLEAFGLEEKRHRLGREGRPCMRDGSRVQFSAADGAAAMPAVARAASELGVGVERLAMRKRTLEDVFIRLTGRGLRE